MDVKVNMPGQFSVYNALAALAVGKVLDLPDQAIHDGLGRCVVKGRGGAGAHQQKSSPSLLDYAHNEVSTESLPDHPARVQPPPAGGGVWLRRQPLQTAARYGMGEICARMADFSILTEDNNRFEKGGGHPGRHPSGDAAGQPRRPVRGDPPTVWTRCTTRWTTPSPAT